MSGPASVELCPEIPALSAHIFASADRDGRLALKLARRQQARAATLPPFEQALSYHLLGYAWLRWERLDEAEAALGKACQGFAALGEARLVLHLRRALLYAALLRGDGTERAEDWDALAQECARAGDQLGAARARLGQMIVLNLNGLSQESLRLAQAIGPVLEGEGAPGDRAWLLRLRGVALIDQAAFEEATDCLNQAAAIFAGLGQQAELAKTWMEHSRLYMNRSDLARAANYIEQAQQAMQQLDLPLRVAICTKNLGWCAALRGAYDRGLQLSLAAYDQLAAIGRTDYMAGCDLNLGNIAYFAGMWDLALLAYQRAELVYRQLGRLRMQLICQHNLAQALRLSGRPEAALAQAQPLLSLARQLDDPLEAANILLTQGRALADLGHIAAAGQKLAQAEAEFRTIGSQASVGASLLEQAQLKLGQGESRAAEPLLRKAHLLLAESPIERWRADYGLGRCAELRGDLRGALTFYSSACRTVALLRQRLANEHASSGLFGQARQLAEDALLLALRLDAAGEFLALAEIQRSLALSAQVRAEQTRALSASEIGGAARPTGREPAGEALDPALQQSLQAYLERRLRQRRPHPAVDEEPAPDLDLDQLRADFQQAFPAGWTLLTYVSCADKLVIVVVTPDTASLVATPFDAELRQLLRRVSEPGHQPMSLYFEGPPQAADELAWPTLSDLSRRLLPEPLAQRLTPTQRLLIVASGPLHSVPWAALPVQGGWLVEHAIPQILPGLRIWQELAGRRPPGKSAMLIGVSHFGPRAPELRHVPEILDAVQARWPDHVTRLEQDDATVEALIELAGWGELRRYGLLHFATHGQLVAASGLYAHLKLADGDLSYDDVIRLGLAGALVVLATCDGAAAEVLPGEEVLSLSRAFLAAGARDVIANTWKLYEAALPDFLDLLYYQLAAGHDAPSALALAQRAWIRRGNEDQELDTLLQAPLVWAGLSAIGAGTA